MRKLKLFLKKMTGIKIGNKWGIKLGYKMGYKSGIKSRNNRFDSSKASKELGYNTRSYRETIRDEIIWPKETGKIA